MVVLRRGLVVIELCILIGLATLVGAVEIAHHHAVRYGVVVALAAAVGLQTGLSRLMAVADVNTTVATMTLHDLAAQSPLAGQARIRWRRCVGVVVCLVAGAAVGVGMDRPVPWGGLTVCCVILAGVLCAAIRFSGGR